MYVFWKVYRYSCTRRGSKYDFSNITPLQPCNHDDSDGASEGGAGQDACVTDPSDHEDEPENDDWFDQLISSSVSQEDILEVEARELQETQLDESQALTQTQFQDSQPRPETELDDLPDSQPCPPIPLQGPAEHKGIMEIDDSPVRPAASAAPAASCVVRPLSKKEQAMRLREKIQALQLLIDETSYWTELVPKHFHVCFRFYCHFSIYLSFQTYSNLGWPKMKPRRPSNSLTRARFWWLSLYHLEGTLTPPWPWIFQAMHCHIRCMTWCNEVKLLPVRVRNRGMEKMEKMDHLTNTWMASL